MKIAHVSDLHFGCIEPAVVEALVATLHAEPPDLVIASGDLTQSATATEFAAARAFFDRLPWPRFVIPGNHDLPGLDPMRFIDPFGRYRHAVSDDLEPALRTPLIDIKGLNSARRLLPHPNWANGAVSARQCDDIARFFAASTAPWRMVVLHHPLVSAKELPLDVVVFGRRRAMATLGQQKVDLVLAGHQHHAFVDPIAGGDHTTLFVNASTATSKRLRRQPNGFNWLELTPSEMRVKQMRFEHGAFVPFSAMVHLKD